ncbi:MAG: ABC transporter substrate-binding protein [Candidatus Tectomicrobia bacterium]|nr:ABC transporter substrate-binding protein [Candidatus Tectomicrobia bacterium]
MKRTIWKAGVAVVAALLFQVSFEARAADRVTFQLGWVPSGRDLAFFAAKGQGFYRNKGLDVNLVRGYGGADAIQKAATKVVEFAFGDVAQNILGRSKREANVKQLFMYHAKAMYAITTLEGLGIRTPKDLEGKKLGGPPGDATWAVFPALAAANGLDRSTITIVHMDPAATVPSLLSGRVQGIGAWVYQFPIVKKAAAKQGKKPYLIAFSKWGVDIYNIGVVAHDDTINQRPDLARRFVEATALGAKYAIENPEKAIEDFARITPEMDKEVNLEMWRITAEYMVTPEALQNGLGYMAEAKWNKTREIVASAYKISSPPPVSELYTNRFVTKVIPKR